MPPNVLVIDIDEGMYRLFCDCLAGCSMTCMTKPPTDLAEITSLAPDLIILDCWFHHPHACCQLLRQLRHQEAASHIPVVICTADTQFLPPFISTLNDPTIQVLPKPFFLEALWQCIAEAAQIQMEAIFNEAQRVELEPRQCRTSAISCTPTRL